MPKTHLQKVDPQDFLSHSSKPTLREEQASQSRRHHLALLRREDENLLNFIEQKFFNF